MSKKINERFVKLYIELDKLCCQKLGVTTGGMGEYINRLNSIRTPRIVPRYDEFLKHLVAYRDLHKLFYFKPEEVRKNDKLLEKDIKWLKEFKKLLNRKKDPVAVYIKKMQKYVSRRKAATTLKIILALAAAGCIAGVVAWMMNQP